MRDQRIENEFDILQQAALAAPMRISSLVRVAAELRFTLHQAPCLTAAPNPRNSTWDRSLRAEQAVRITFPRYFPAMPIEAFVEGPVFHPNAHPDTGFLCLWSIHRVAHTVLNSIARIAAVLSWRLVNREPAHTMQPAALLWFDSLTAEEQSRIPLPLEPLPFPCTALPPSPGEFRRRLS